MLESRKFDFRSKKIQKKFAIIYKSITFAPAFGSESKFGAVAQLVRAHDS